MCVSVVQIFECKSELNKRLLHLRDWKLEIIDRVSGYITVPRLCAILVLLWYTLRSHLWWVRLRPCRPSYLPPYTSQSPPDHIPGQRKCLKGTPS